MDLETVIKHLTNGKHTNLMSGKQNIIKIAKESISRFNFFNLTLVIFLSIFSLYQVHRFTGGSILSSPFYTYLFFFLFFLIFSNGFWPWTKMDIGAVKEYRWLIISLLSVLLVVGVWSGAHRISGDYNIHKQFTLQLLNGSPETHFYYRDAPGGFYPPLSHATLATFSNLTGFGVKHSYLLVSLLIAFFIPLVSYKIARKLGFSPNLSFFFASLISLYGGFFGNFFGVEYSSMFHLYLPALQIAMPFISRNISYLIFLLFLFLFIKLFQLDHFSFSKFIILGVLIGLMGVTHPQGLIISLLCVFIACIANNKWKFLSKEKLVSLFSILFVGFFMASFYYIPLILKFRQYGGIETNRVSMSEVFPDILELYGLLLFCVSGLLLRGKKGIENRDIRTWIFVSIFMILMVIIIRVFLGMIASIDEWTVFRIHRYGSYLFIFLALIVSAGLKSIISRINIRKKDFLAVVATIFIALFSCYQSSNYLDWIFKFDHNVFHIIIKEPSKVFYFPNRENEELRFKVDDPQRTIVVPPGFTDFFSSETGFNVSYIERHRIPYKNFFEEAISQKERRRKTKSFYRELGAGRLRKDILSFFDADTFVAPQNDLDEIHNVKKIGVFLSDERRQPLYQMK